MARIAAAASRAERARLPEEGQDGDGQAGAGFIPDAVLVAGLHLELVLAGRQGSIARKTPGARLVPLGFMPPGRADSGSGRGRRRRD